MMKNLLLVLLAVLSQASAFAPQTQRLGRNVARQASDESSDVALDPFEAFGPGAADIAVKDLAMGEGEGIVNGDVVTVKYVGRLFANQQQFGSTDALPVKLGQGNLVAGFEKALVGRKPGSEFVLRIPAALAWAERGRFNDSGRQVIPPGADVEFEIEVLNVSNGIMGEIEMFGAGRVATLIFCICLSAFAPQIEKIVNSFV